MLEILQYDDSLAERWDEHCRRSINGTFLHTRRFLSYHGDRLRDRSVVVLHDGELVAILPAAEAISDQSLVVSHPGATYGGFVHDGWLTGQRMLDAVEGVVAHFHASGFSAFRYKAVPYVYANCPAQDDSYAFFRLGATRVRCDLSSSIDLGGRRTPSQRRRRALRKARSNVVVIDGLGLLPAFYEVLVENLDNRHGARPVHRLDELQLLADRFPDEIALSVATVGERIVAGVLFFQTARVVHAQYIASTREGQEVSALDAIFEDAISAAAIGERRYFDFGISNEDEGLILNEGLYRFKTEFGGGGVVHEQYEINCK